MESGRKFALGATLVHTLVGPSRRWRSPRSYQNGNSAVGIIADYYDIFLYWFLFVVHYFGAIVRVFCCDRKLKTPNI